MTRCLVVWLATGIVVVSEMWVVSEREEYIAAFKATTVMLSC